MSDPFELCDPKALVKELYERGQRILKELEAENMKLRDLLSDKIGPLPGEGGESDE